jgi:glutamyl-tRNA synthetase
MHLGNGRTALLNWLFARHCGGTFLLRVDDTDTQRSEERFTQALLEDLQWLGLCFDGFYRQSERAGLYRQHIDRLVEKGRLYPCYETPEELGAKRRLQLSQKKPPIYDREALTLSEAQRNAYESQGRRPHWRFFLNPETVGWDDLIRGPLSCSLSNLSDPVVIREDGSVGFLLAGAIDDGDLGITHILRGEDHITNTAVQIHLLQALDLGKGGPEFGHFSLLTDEAGKGFSKRLGSLSLQELRHQGALPLGVATFLEALGTADAPQVVASLDALASGFSLKRYGRATPKLSVADLWTLNAKFFQQMSFDTVLSLLKAKGWAEGVTPDFWEVICSSVSRLEDVLIWKDVCERTRESVPSPLLTQALLQGDVSLQSVAAHLTETFRSKALETLPLEPWSQDTWVQWTQALRELTGLKGAGLYGPLRLAITGRLQGPEMRRLLPFLTRECVQRRLASSESDA